MSSNNAACMRQLKCSCSQDSLVLLLEMAVAPPGFDVLKSQFGTLLSFAVGLGSAITQHCACHIAHMLLHGQLCDFMNNRLGAPIYMYQFRFEAGLAVQTIRLAIYERQTHIF